MIVEHAPAKDKLDTLSVSSWPVWECNISEFPWAYDSSETCYLMAGEVLVTPDGSAPVKIQAGDLAVFPAGMSCRWNVLKVVCKHYRFD